MIFKIVIYSSAIKYSHYFNPHN